MFDDAVAINGSTPNGESDSRSTTFSVKTGLAKMLKGGVIMDVVNAEQVGKLSFRKPEMAMMALI